jgi:hypothetical protein
MRYVNAVSVVDGCMVLGGGGLPLDRGWRGEVVFGEDSVCLRGFVVDDVVIPYGDITAIEIGGRGRQRTGGGFRGGGFGLQGAAEGMLIASALNTLTTRTSVDTVICLRTATAELFLHHTRMTPEQLRIELSAVFTILRSRGSKHEREPTGGDRPIAAADRVSELARLLERGLITEDEFLCLKAGLLD